MVLPATGTGARAMRRRATQVRRKRRVVRSIAGLVLLVSISGSILLVLSVRSPSQNEPDDSGLGSQDELPVGEAAAKALFIHENESGELSSVAVVVLSAEGSGGNVLFVPPHIMVESAGLNLEPLSKSYEVGGVELVASAIQNLLGVGFEHVVFVDRISWTTFVSDFGRLVVENPRDVEIRDENERVSVVYPRGSISIEASEVGAYLEAEGVGETELDRLVRHDAVWKSWLEEISKVDLPIGDVERDLEALLGELAAGEVAWSLLPVESRGVIDNEGIYGVLRDQLEELIRNIAPETRGEAARRVGVQILNGTGIPDLASVATDILVPVGARIDLTGNALTFDHDITQIVYYRDEDFAAAQRLRDALGLGEVLKSRNELDAVDITVVLGFDFVDSYL